MTIKVVIKLFSQKKVSDIFKRQKIWKQKSKADNEEFYYIRSTDEIMQLIEEHGGTLGNHKSSPYYKEFDTKIDLWESNIA